MLLYILALSTVIAKLGDFECIDDTKFKLFTSDTAFVVNSCPPGFCATRNPKFKNPCVGKANADRIDGAAASATGVQAAAPAALPIAAPIAAAIPPIPPVAGQQTGSGVKAKPPFTGQKATAATGVQGSAINSSATGALADTQILSFLNTNANNFNDATIVPLDSPEILPTNRQKSAAEGCKLAQNGFICVDLARNVRCVDGLVSKNFVKPFSQNDLIKSCVGGFCGGTKLGDNPGGNKCVGTAEQALEGSKNGNEFFLPPP